MVRRTAVAAVVAMVIGLVGLLGPGPTTAGAQTAEATLTVTPSTGLIDGQVVRVDGAGFPPGSNVGFFVCTVGQAFPCGLRGFKAVDVSPSGALSLAYPVVPCGAPTCELLAVPLVGETLGAETRRPLSFDGVAPVPTLTVEIDPYGTADDDGLAVVSAQISCNVATPLTAVADVTQLDTWGETAVGHFTLADECTPEEPVWAFFPTRQRTEPEADDPFIPGSVIVQIQARVGLQTWTNAIDDDVTLLDQESLAETIQTALQDPAEVELRAAIVRAIQARVRQDPVFAAEWWAQIKG